MPKNSIFGEKRQGLYRIISNPKLNVEIFLQRRKGRKEFPGFLLFVISAALRESLSDTILRFEFSSRAVQLWAAVCLWPV